jgi:hypothetical protein
MCRSQDQVHWRMYKIVHTLHAPTCLQIINFYWNPNSIQWVTILTSKINVQNIDNGFCQISSTSRAIDVINQAPLQTPYQTLSLELLFFHESLKLIKLWSKQFYPYLCLTGPARKLLGVCYRGGFVQKTIANSFARDMKSRLMSEITKNKCQLWRYNHCSHFFWR